MGSLWHPLFLHWLRHGSPPVRRTQSNAQLRLLDRRSVLLMLALLAGAPIAIGTSPPPGGQSERSIGQSPLLPKGVPGKFRDVTSDLDIDFRYLSSHTPKKYLIETMGTGVALFDLDNDGRLDIFLVNGAPLTDPMPRTAIPRKTGSQYWNRLYHQKSDGRFEDITEKAG